jgi:methylglutaconyl-CoA hydratase
VADFQAYTARVIAELRQSPEGQEGMDAFLNKRKPKWVE